MSDLLFFQKCGDGDKDLGAKGHEKLRRSTELIPNHYAVTAEHRLPYETAYLAIWGCPIY